MRMGPKCRMVEDNTTIEDNVIEIVTRVIIGKTSKNI